MSPTAEHTVEQKITVKPACQRIMDLARELRHADTASYDMKYAELQDVVYRALLDAR